MFRRSYSESFLVKMPVSNTIVFFLQHYTELEIARLIARQNPQATRIYFSHLPHPAKYSYFDREKRMKWHQKLEEFCLVWAETVVTPSNYSKRVLTATYSISGSRIYVVPHATHSPINTSNSDRIPMSFITVGRFTEQKGWRALINLMEALELESVDPRWLIVGDGPLRKQVSKMIRQRISPNRVEFQHSLTPDELQVLLRKNQFYVQTSEYESFGLAVMEAVSCGCIPILTDIPVFREVFGSHEDVCFLKPTHFSETLSKVISYASAEPLQISRASRKFVSQCYTQERHTEVLKTLIQGAPCT